MSMPNFSSRHFHISRNQTFHVLTSINIGEEYYQQVITETVNELNNKHLVVLTHNKDGVILSRDIIEGTFGDKYEVIITQELINDKGQREITIQTVDENGKSIAQHVVTVSDEDFRKSQMAQRFQQGKITTLKQNGQIIRVYSLAPLIYGKNFYKQKLYEVSGGMNQRSRTLVTFDQLGNIIGRDLVLEEHLAKNYATQIIEENVKGGRTTLLIATKNERGETINMKEVNPRFYSEAQEKLFKDFQKKAKGRSSLGMQEKVRGSTNFVKNQILRPSIYANNFYQQILDEIIDGNDKRITIVTKNEKGEILSKSKINADKLDKQQYKTVIAEIEGEENKLMCVTIDEDGNVLLKQELQKRMNELLNDEYVIDFDEKAKNKNTLIEENQSGQCKVKTYTLRPANIMSQTYQQIIIDLIDEYGEKERLLILKDKEGNILMVDQIEDTLDLEGDLTQKFAEDTIDKKKAATICIFNNNNQIVGKQTISNQNMNKRNLTVQYVKDDKNGLLRYTFKVEQIGLNHYKQVVEEIIDDNNQMEVIIKNMYEDNILDQKIVEGRLIGTSYCSRVGKSYINNQGVRKTIIEIVNDEQKILGFFEVDNEARLTVTSYDGNELSAFRQNTITSKKVSSGLVTLKKLRSIQIGRQSYDFFFQEVIGNNGQKRLTMIVKDEKQQQIGEEEINPQFISDNYESYLKHLIDDKNRKVSRIEFRNQKDKLICFKDFILDEDELPLMEYDKIIETIDKDGNRSGTVFIKNKNNTTYKTHKLGLTLVGSEYYQSTVNELFENGVLQRSTLVISNERGETVKVCQLDTNMESEQYYQEVLDELIQKGREREISVIIKNDNDEIILKEKIKPERNSILQANDIYSNIVEELINQQGQKRVTVLANDKHSHILDTIQELESQLERSSSIDHEKNIERFENLLNKYGGVVKPNRMTYNEQKPTREKGNTLNVLMKEDEQNFVSFGKNQEKFSQQNQEKSDKHGISDSKKDLVEETQRMSNFKDNYYESVRDSKTRKEDDEMKRVVSNLLSQEKDKLIMEIMEKMKSQKSLGNTDDLVEEFKHFCKYNLPQDKEYKDSVMMVSLFYYYMKRKNLRLN